MSRTYQITLEHEGEKRELDLLNTRFGNYLKKIKHLVSKNSELRRQIDDVYHQYFQHTDNQLQQTTIVKLNQLRQQLDTEVRAQASVQIRLQRANYDIQFFRNHLKSYSVYEQKQSEQIQSMKQQLQTNLNEFEQLKQQYQQREEDLLIQKNQYAESMNKLAEFSKEYDRISYERMENENHLRTLKEQFIFEQEYHQRRQQEFEYLEKFHVDFHREFTRNEFQNIIEKIRKDYQEFNALSLIELEKFYKIKLDKAKTEFTQQEQKTAKSKSKEIHQTLHSTRQEQRSLIEQNLLLKDRLEQLEQDLRHIVEQNHQHFEVSNREYNQLQIEIPELDYIIVHLRENTVNLWSEINTYRYLLVNLLSPTATEKPIQPAINKTTTVGTRAQQYRDEATGFIVHIEDGIVWVRI